MSMEGLHPAYCARCGSHHCNHAIDMNAHNMRLQHERSMMMAGQNVAAWDSVLGVTATGRGVELATAALQQPQYSIPNRKLLLLRRAT